MRRWITTARLQSNHNAQNKIQVARVADRLRKTHCLPGHYAGAIEVPEPVPTYCLATSEPIVSYQVSVGGGLSRRNDPRSHTHTGIRKASIRGALHCGQQRRDSIGLSSE